MDTKQFKEEIKALALKMNAFFDDETVAEGFSDAYQLKRIEENRAYVAQLVAEVANELASKAEAKVTLYNPQFGEVTLDYKNSEIETCPFSSRNNGARAAAVPSSTHGLKIIQVK